MKKLKDILNEVLPKFKTPYEAYDWIMGKRNEAMGFGAMSLSAQKIGRVCEGQEDTGEGRGGRGEERPLMSTNSH